MSEADRIGWHVYGETLSPVVDGRLLFMSTFSTAIDIKLRGVSLGALLSTPPINPGNLDLNRIRLSPLTAPGTGFKLLFNRSGSETQRIFGYLSKPVNASRVAFPRSWDTSVLLWATVNSTSLASIKFENLISGRYYFFRGRFIITSAPFRLSKPFVFRSIATTFP